jgi:hypothetical protein
MIGRVKEEQQLVENLFKAVTDILEEDNSDMVYPICLEGCDPIKYGQMQGTGLTLHCGCTTIVAHYFTGENKNDADRVKAIIDLDADEPELENECEQLRALFSVLKEVVKISGIVPVNARAPAESGSAS